MIETVSGKNLRKVFIIAGEESGDLRGAQLIKDLLDHDNALTIVGWGGDEMQRAGMEIRQHIKHTSFMGFTQVVRNLITIMRLFKKCKNQIKAFDPDLIIFIDYPGFNLRMAKWSMPLRAKKVYYISPQVWAWKANRVKIIEEYIDRLLVILPFEEKFYADRGIKVHFVGHPLVKLIKGDTEQEINNREDSLPLLALLPGSRKQEIGKILPVMLAAIVTLKNEFDFVIAGTSNIGIQYYKDFFLGHDLEVPILLDKVHNIMQSAYLALVTSGTATLETALFGVPQVVCYKSSRLNYIIARRLVDVPFIALANLIAEKKIVPELIQDQCNIANIRKEMTKLRLPSVRQQVKSDYKELRDKLIKPDISPSAVQCIYELFD